MPSFNAHSRLECLGDNSREILKSLEIEGWWNMLEIARKWFRNVQRIVPESCCPRISSWLHMEWKPNKGACASDHPQWETWLSSMALPLISMYLITSTQGTQQDFTSRKHLGIKATMNYWKVWTHNSSMWAFHNSSLNFESIFMGANLT